MTAIAASAVARQSPKTVTVPFTYADFGTLATTVAVTREACRLPPGSIVLDVKLNVGTAFNSATSDALDVGYSLNGSVIDADDFVAAADVQAVGVKAQAAASDVGKVLSTAYETVIQLKLTPTGASVASAGAGRLSVTYIESAAADSVYG